MIPASEVDRVLTTLSPLLAIPYKLNGQYPEAFDCWTFTRHLQNALWSRKLEHVPLPVSGMIRDMVKIIRDHPEHKKWKVVNRPSHSCLVELSHSKHPHHIGTWLDIDGGGIAHCDAVAGVSFDPIVALKATGWQRFIFYEWIG